MGPVSHRCASCKRKHWAGGGLTEAAAESASVHSQIENEFGFVGPNEPYMRHLHTLARDNLGNDVQFFTTDPPAVITKGSLGGDWSFA